MFQRNNFLHHPLHSQESLRLSSSPTSYRRSCYDNLSSPPRLDSSQDGRVYWDMDTPEGKRLRAQYAKEYMAMEDSPKLHQDTRTPRLELITAPMLCSVKSSPVAPKVTSARGMEVLNELMNLVAEADKQNQENENLNQNLNVSAEADDVPIVPREIFKENDPDPADEDMFEDDFDDWDDDMLIQATQAAEDQVKETDSNERLTSVQPAETEAANPGFDSFDDSFDAIASQVTTPVLANTKTSHNVVQKKILHPNVVKCQNDGFESGNDSFDEFLSQMEMPSSSATNNKVQSSPTLKKSAPKFQFKKTSPEKCDMIGIKSLKPASSGSSSVRDKLVSSSPSSSMNNFRKFSSFDSPPREKKVIAKFRSDSHIVKQVCSKEDIERKRKEALARRQVSQSQKRKK